MLAWCPMDNIGVRFLLGDIALLKGDHHAARPLRTGTRRR
jgi:hypothetical protein